MYDKDHAAWKIKQAAWKESHKQPANQKKIKQQIKDAKKADLLAQLAALE